MKRKEIPPHHKKRLKDIGSLIRECRFSEGWTQQMLSEYCNLNRNTISRAENGRNISVITILEVAETLDISLAELFDDFD